MSSGVVGSFVFREAVGDVLDAADAAVFGKVADNQALGVANGWNFAVGGSGLEGFFELADTFASGTE